jgi:hypothetical protein
MLLDVIHVGRDAFVQVLLRLLDEAQLQECHHSPQEGQGVCRQTAVQGPPAMAHP